jgi:predicted DNA-binding transcriptional regulator AlpA
MSHIAHHARPARRRATLADAPPVSPAMVRGPELPALLRMSRSTLFRVRRTDPRFPRPVALPSGTRTLLYRRVDIDAYIASLATREQIIPSWGRIRDDRSM